MVVPVPLRPLVAATIMWGSLGAAPAHADLVFLTSGRSLSVQGHRYEGDQVVLSLRGGGEITCDRSLVAEIRPDEVPYPEARPVQAAHEAGQALPRTPVGELIDSVSRAHGISSDLVRAVVEVESGYEANARSPKGAMGLMQLMPATARQYAVDNPYDPQANLDAGTRHLKSLLSRMELPLALAAYNAGEAAVRRYRGIPPYAETRDYVRRVLQRLRR
jgi:soluble lytic murein transglycosylase-like protein